MAKSLITGKLLWYIGDRDGFVLVNMDNGKVDGTVSIKLQTDSHGELPFIFYPMRITPDGKALAYLNNVNDVSNIWAQPLDGAAAYPITSFPSDEIRDFHWSPSGEQLGFVRGRMDSNVVLIREANP